jgi:hypothetical protein
MACAAITPRAARCVALWCKSPVRTVSLTDTPRTLAGLQDKGTSAENVIQIGRGPSRNARLSGSGWAAGDTIPSLTERVHELETALASIQANLEKEQRRLASYSDFDANLNDAASNAYRKANAIRSLAQQEANVVLERAVNERKMLMSEVERLRQERDELEDEIASLHRGGLAAVPARVPVLVEPEAAQPSFDMKAAVAQEMRAMLAALIEEVRARPAPARAPTAPVAPPEPPPAPAVAMVAPPTETIDPIVHEDVVEPSQSKLAPPSEIESEDLLADARALEFGDEVTAAPPQPSAIEAEDVLAETQLPIVDEYVEEFRKPAASFGPSEQLANDVVAPEPPKRVFDEYVEEFIEPEMHEPIVEEYVAELPAAEAPAQYVEELPRSQLPTASEIETEDVLAEATPPVVEEYVEEPPAAAAPLSPPTANIDALWETAATPTAEVEPPAAPPEAPIAEPVPPVILPRREAVSFISDEFIAATRPGSPQDTEPVAPPQFFDVPSPAPYAEPEGAPAPFAEVEEAPAHFAEPEEAPTSFAEVEEAPAPFAYAAPPPPAVEPLPPTSDVPATERAIGAEPAVRRIQVVISPIHSFTRLIEIQQRIQTLSSVRGLQLRDFRNGMATFAVGVSDAISPLEFGAVIQMLENLHLRLEGTSQNSVELRVEDNAPSA